MAEVLIFVLYLLGIYFTFNLIERVVRNRYGDYVADDKLTRAAVFTLAALLMVGGVQLLAFITGHLSGRL